MIRQNEQQWGCHVSKMRTLLTQTRLQDLRQQPHFQWVTALVTHPEPLSIMHVSESLCLQALSFGGDGIRIIKHGQYRPVLSPYILKWVYVCLPGFCNSFVMFHLKMFPFCSHATFDKTIIKPYSRTSLCGNGNLWCWLTRGPLLSFIYPSLCYLYVLSAPLNASGRQTQHYTCSGSKR